MLERIFIAVNGLEFWTFVAAVVAAGFGVAIWRKALKLLMPTPVSELPQYTHYVLITDEGPKPGQVYVWPLVLEDVIPGDSVVFHNAFTTKAAAVSFPNGASPFTDPDPFEIAPDGIEKRKIRSASENLEYPYTVKVEGLTEASPKIIIRPSSSRD